VKGKFLFVALAAAIIGFGSQSAQAAGPHDANCVSCHNVHYAKGNFIIGPQPNTSMDNPAANAKVAGVDALCLGCHNDAEGIMPIHLSTTHPTGVAPTYVKVPEKLLRDGKMSCVSCHNPHPSNTNYKYLVADTKKGNNMGVFCAVCHGEQADGAERTSAGSAALNFGPRAEARVAVSGSVKEAAAAKPAPVAKPVVANPAVSSKPAAAVKY
jgi:predicted CXXCH cytochrome family protein